MHQFASAIAISKSFTISRCSRVAKSCFKFLLFIAYLARCPFHGLGLSDCDFLDGSAAFVQTSTVAVGMVAFGLWAGTDIHHAALQRFKSLEAVQFSYATCNVLRTFKW